MVDAFKKLDDAQVELHPFPHLVVEDILPDDVCDALLREMPPLHVLTHGQPAGDDRRFNFSYTDAIAARDISPLWREVLAQAVSQEFLDRLLRLFGPSIRELYPDFEDRFAPLHKLKAEQRAKKARRWPSSNARKANSVMLDAQIAVNTPALTGGSSVRPPHLDRTDKIFIGLLYLRLPEDDSKGADLELLTPNEDRPLVYGDKRMLPAEQAKHVRTIPYRRNTLVLFLNTSKSLHGVTPRQATPHTRYFINLVAETCKPLFEVETSAPPPEQTVTLSTRRPGLFDRFWSGFAGRDRGARPGA